MNAPAEVLNDPLAQDMMNSPALARLAYIGRDGNPRAIPIGYLWNGTDFVMCTAVNATKVRALQTNPNVAFTVDTEGTPPRILLVRGTAEVDIVDGVPDEFLQASRRYIPEEQWAGFEAAQRETYPQMARISIDPTWAKLIDFERTLPQAVAHLANERNG
jgi:hypothetical protein